MSEEKKYYWLKLQEDFFSSKRIKKLRRLAGGDTFTIIYLKMQLLSLAHGGYLRYDGLEDSFADELALDLDEDIDNVKVTLAYLTNCGLLEIINDTEYFLPYVQKNTASESKWAEKKRNYRGRIGHCEDNVLGKLGQCPTDIDIEKEIDIDKKNMSTKQALYDEVASTYNRVCSSLPKVNVLSDKRKKSIERVFLKEKVIHLEDIESLYKKVEESDFLSGRNGSWRATFDWIMNPTNIAKVLDGNYENHSAKKGNQFNEMIHTDYDFDELERRFST